MSAVLLAMAMAMSQLGLPPLPAPPAAQAALGRKLFFDRRLSVNGTQSCAMCHLPEQGFTTTTSRTSVGLAGRSLRRNAPTLLNVAWQRTLFHDGRESRLDTLAWLPLLHPDEMGNSSIGGVLDRVATLPDYAVPWRRAFGGRKPSVNDLGSALAAYQRTLVAGGSRFDRWRFGGEVVAMTAQERRGFALFTGRAGCGRCHPVGERWALFTDHGFHATGAGDAADLGRMDITQNPAHLRAFRTPSLRNVAITPPYMHDGSLATLEDVIDFYNRGTAHLPPLGLALDEKAALGAFLRSLTGSSRER